MNDRPLTLDEKSVNSVRRLSLLTASRCEEHGVSPGQIALGTLLGAFEIAKRIHGDNGVAATEWMRTNLDAIERNEFPG